MISNSTTVAVIGLGYVGLPLAVEFGKKFRTIGLDLSREKISAYEQHFDPTGEVSTDEFKTATLLEVTTDARSLADADFLIVTVPTPVDIARKPDFSSLIAASKSVGCHMRRGATVIYESTVYPGATEEVCIPILERESGWKWKIDFHVSYSPERINPGDKEHSLTRVTKVVSGDDSNTLEVVAALYESIVTAGIYRTSSLKIAEAAKVIENTQRDLNVALMNELALIFDRIGIDTAEVLAAAGTKWNFLKFKPGLVGGHCIGVDPYYLTYKAEMLGYHPQMITAGRRINDGMGKFIAEKTVKLLAQRGDAIKNAKVIILGLTFKENCPDLRNSRVPDIINELVSYGICVDVHDPLANVSEASHEYGFTLCAWDDLPAADALVLAVAHQDYLALSVEQLQSKLLPGALCVDVKAALDKPALEAAGHKVWRL